MPPITRRLLVVLLFLAATADAAHITDKLVVGIYAEPSVEGSPKKLISSGTPLEILERKTQFVRVRMADQTTGWVESAYVTEEKPAKALLLETQTKLRQMKKELDALKAENESEVDAAGSADAPSAPSARERELQDALDKANARIEALQQAAAAPQVVPEIGADARLDQLETRVQRAIDLLSAGELPVESEQAATRPGIVTRHQAWIVGLIALVVGFGVGVAFIDYRFRKRYAGLRI